VMPRLTLSYEKLARRNERENSKLLYGIKCIACIGTHTQGTCQATDENTITDENTTTPNENKQMMYPHCVHKISKNEREKKIWTFYLKRNRNCGVRGSTNLIFRLDHGLFALIFGAVERQ
jgi:hypothetical protein